MQLISRTAPTRNRSGFTLIEMMVIVVLLALFSAAVAPNLVAMRDSQQRRALMSGATDLAATAREMALSNCATVYLQADTSQNALVIMMEDDSSAYQNVQGSSSSSGDTVVINGHVQSTRTKTNIGTSTLEHSNDKSMKTLPLTSGIQFGNFQLGGSSSDAGSWKLHFYADGTCDGGAVELADGKVTKTIVVNTRGGVKMIDGTLPDSSQDQWSAGDYVHRQ